MFDGIINTLVSIYDFIYDFGLTCINILSYIASIFGFIWYGGKTLIIGVFKILYNILNGSVFYNVNRAFVLISDYIGGPATVVMACLLFIIIVRIIIAFVFKILKLNIDYNSFDKNTRKANSWYNSSEHHKRMNTRS